MKEVQQESTVLSGPKSSAQTPLKVNPWSGRLRSPSASPNASIGSTGKNVNSAKGKKKVDQPMAVFDVSAGHSMANHDSSGKESLDEEFGIPKVQTLGVCRSTRAKYPVERLKYDSFAAHHFMYMANVVQVQEPTCFSDAVGVEQWNVAMDEEMNALDDSGTWELTPLPEEKKAIGCKWVYKIKHNADGSINKYKARLVAKGYAQTYGIYFEETFSPVAKMATMRAVIAMAAAK